MTEDAKKRLICQLTEIFPYGKFPFESVGGKISKVWLEVEIRFEEK